MALSMYQASVPVFRSRLKGMAAILAKGEAYAAAKNIDPSVLLQTRLFPDMFPLVRQVQIMSDAAKGCTANLAGIEVPRFEDVETTFPEIKERIEKTIRFVESVRPEQIDGSEDKDIKLNIRGNTLSFKGQDYLLNFALPNLYFHMTASYAILRHCGVEIGKRDFLGMV